MEIPIWELHDVVKQPLAKMLVSDYGIYSRHIIDIFRNEVCQYCLY